LIVEKRFVDHKKKIHRSQMEKYSLIAKTNKFADREDFFKMSGWRLYLSMSKFIGFNGFGTRRSHNGYLKIVT
jgi:lysozyme family protein